MKKTALFGGTLLAAGMSAQAQEFQYSATDSTGAYSSFAVAGQVYVDAFGYAAFAYNVAYGAGADTSYAGFSDAYFGGLSSSVQQDASSIRMEAQWDGGGFLGYGYGGAYVQSFFQVSEDAFLNISWDLSGTDGFNNALVIEDPSFTEIFSLDNLGGDPLVGSAQVALSAGTDYALLGGLEAGAFPFFFDTNVQFIEFTLSPIPTPGSAGLLAVAGLAAARRRRN